MEDLYLYLIKSWEAQEEKLFDCICTVKENVSDTIEIFEEVKAKSLNEAYKNTFVHYFGNKGHPACNALDRFYSEEGNENVLLVDLGNITYSFKSIMAGKTFFTPNTP